MNGTLDSMGNTGKSLFNYAGSNACFVCVCDRE